MPTTLLRLATRLLAVAGLGISLYLTGVSLGTAPAVGCDFTSEAGCGAALASRWSKWFGAPVAAGGVLTYAAALVGSLLAMRDDSAGAAGWRLLEAASALAVGAGVWFAFVQLAWLEGLCPWCLATHACGLLMAIAAVLWRNGDHETGGTPAPVGDWVGPAPVLAASGPPAYGPATIGGMLGVVALIVGQVVAGVPAPTVIESPVLEGSIALADDPPPVGPSLTGEEASEETSAPAPERERRKPRRRAGGSRKVSLLDGQFSFDTYKQAVLGSPDAPYIVAEMMDYACPHCREFHEIVTEALERFDGQFAVVVLPTPTEITCNKYIEKADKNTRGACYAAKLSLAVSEADPRRFEEFHEWMLAEDEIPQRTTSLVEARRLVDGDRLSELMRDPDKSLTQRVQQHIELAAAINRVGKFRLPCQIVGDRIMTGKIESVEDLVKLWADTYGVEAP